MKRMAQIGFAVSLILIFSQCAKKETADTRLTPEEEKRVVAFADSLANQLIQTLVTELAKAMQEGGPENAISVCNLKALPLTADVARMHGESVDIKRTTRKYRNPKNAPDEREKAALTYFEQKIQAGELPPYYVQKFKNQGQPVYRDYKPRKGAQVWLNCHGDAKTMSPAGQKKLKALYPEDRATGYKEGDFRGVIRIEIRKPLESE